MIIKKIIIIIVIRIRVKTKKMIRAENHYPKKSLFIVLDK